MLTTIIRIFDARQIHRHDTVPTACNGFWTCLRNEGYIRGLTKQKTGAGLAHPAIRNQPQVFEGEPVIRELKRVLQNPVRRVYMGVNDNPVSVQGLGVSIVLHRTQGCDVESECTQHNCWRQSALHRYSKEKQKCFSYGKKTGRPANRGVSACRDGQTNRSPKAQREPVPKATGRRYI